MGPRLERARQLAVLGAKTVGVIGTVAVLGVLWVALHAEENKALLAMLADADE